MQVMSRAIDSDMMTPNLFKDILELFHDGYQVYDTNGHQQSRKPSVVMFRRKVSDEDGFILTAIEAGLESALRPIVKRESTHGPIWEEMPECTTLSRSQTTVFHPYENETACEDAIHWADILYRSGLIDGYVGLHDYEIVHPERLMLDTISRHCHDAPFNERLLSQTSRFNLYFKDEDTNAFYPVEDCQIWGGAILEHGYYHYLGEYIRLLDVNNLVSDHRTILARTLRKALRHLYIASLEN